MLKAGVMGWWHAACTLSCILGASHDLLGVVQAAAYSSRDEQAHSARSMLSTDHDGALPEPVLLRSGVSTVMRILQEIDEAIPVH
jgi:hypothetical protein